MPKEVKFWFDNACLKAFKFLNEKMISTPIIVHLNGSTPFEITYDASGMGTILANPLTLLRKVIL